MNIAVRSTPVGFDGKLRVYPTKPTGVDTRFVISGCWSMDNFDATFSDAKGPREGIVVVADLRGDLNGRNVGQPIASNEHFALILATAKLSR